MRWKTIDIPGTFGDKLIRLTIGIVSDPQRCVLLFHGVHSSANSEPGNKYAVLGAMLAENGSLPILIETSRLTRDRKPYGNDLLRWVYAAFRGKTYIQELTDAALGFAAAQNLYQSLPLSLWGFSLGGLNALMIAGGFGLPSGIPRPHLDGLVLTGSGDRIRAESAEAMKLPILRDLTSPDKLYDACASLDAQWCRILYGSRDATFDEASCRRLYDRIICRDKEFHRFEGFDHSFRMLNGSPSRRPLSEAVSFLSPLWERSLQNDHPRT